MEFICVSCQTRMVPGEANDAGEQGRTILPFGCPACGHALALNVTPLEAALVRTLGMSVPGLVATPPPQPSPSPSPPQAAGEGRGEGSPRLLWSEKAARALMAVPADQQAIVKRTVEGAARAQGASRITAALLSDITAQIEL